MMEFAQLEFAVIDVVLWLTALLLLFSFVKHYTENSKIPYSIWLLVLGTTAGFFITHFSSLSQEIRLAPPVVFFVLLPILLFDTAIKIKFQRLKHLIVPIFFFASVGVLLSTFAAWLGFWVFADYLPDLGTLDVLLLGALLSATDPVAVGSLFKSFTIPENLHLLIEGESLFNDGTVVVLFALLWSLIAGQGSFSVEASIGHFIMSVAGGLLLGYILGKLAHQLLRGWCDISTPFVMLTISIVIAHGSFLLAEHVLHVSGVLAVVAVGLYFGNQTIHYLPDQRQYFVRTFWDYAAFIANSLLFFLLGAEFAQHHFALALMTLPLVVSIFLLARAFGIYLGSFVLRIFKLKVPTSWQHVLNIGGLRGALSIALILSIPVEYEYRLLFLTVAYVIIFFTLTANVFALVQYLKHQPKITEDLG